jgi:multidrug efflux pump
MNLSQPFISRPVATTLLALGVAMAGIVAFLLLPVASLPEIEFPTISVQASLPGASPEIMATSVAAPLEKQFGRIAGLSQMTSASNLGSTILALQFDLTRDIDGAARDVQAAINNAKSQLPPNLPSNPTYRKVNPADAPILILNVVSDTYTTGQMYDSASTVLQQKLAQIYGVGQIIIAGSSLPAVRVELNPTALGKYAISLENVRNTLASANVNSPKGHIIYNGQSSQITANDQLFRAEDYKPLIIRYLNGAPVHISDVGNVEESVENIRAAGLLDGKPAVILVIFKQPGANVISTVDHIYQILPQLQADIPLGMKLIVSMDRTPTIRASLFDVEMTLMVSVILVILVVYVFLGSARASLIPSVAVPLSLLGTFIVMYLLGYSLNNFSLMALTVATGFVVDDAVVVLENTSRHIEAGMKPLEASLRGAQEVGFTVLSMSISLVVVFAPILLMGGLVGRLFREFAVTLSSAVLISLVVSLTVTPMMCSRILKIKKPEQKPGRLQTLVQKSHRFYEHSLGKAIDRSKLMLLLVALAIAASIVLFIIVPKGFFPQQDTGRVIGSIIAEQDISFQLMRQKLQEFMKILMEDPAVWHAVGVTGNTTVNAGNVYITLKPLRQRKSVDQVINRLRGKLAQVPGATLYLQAAQDLIIGGRIANAQYQYTVFADTLPNLNYWASQVWNKIKNMPGIADLSTDQLNYGLQSFVTYDRNTIARFGLTAQNLDNTLNDAFGQRQVSVIYRSLNQYHVVMEVAPPFWQRPETLNDIYITSSQGNPTPLSVVSQFANSNTLLAVNHTNEFPSATFSFNLLPNVSLGGVVSQITHQVQALHLAGGVQGIFQGTAQAFQQSLVGMPLLVIVALAVIYIVLGILYESLLHPLTILSTLPSAGVGALLALLLTHTDLTIVAFIGIFLLIGIVKKNAIMMIDFALDAKRQEHKAPKEAIYEAAVLRFRPIMMTTLAAMFGVFPLVFGFGVGSELRRPLGIAIVGGLMLSQLLTLYTTPAIYLSLEKAKYYWRKKIRSS